MMIDLLRDAIEMIHDLEKEKSDFINHILAWDDEMRIAFKMAYKIIYDEEGNKKNVLKQHI